MRHRTPSAPGEIYGISGLIPSLVTLTAVSHVYSGTLCIQPAGVYTVGLCILKQYIGQPPAGSS